MMFKIGDKVVVNLPNNKFHGLRGVVVVAAGSLGLVAVRFAGMSVAQLFLESDLRIPRPRNLPDWF